jgi:Terminase small subunit
MSAQPEITPVFFELSGKQATLFSLLALSSARSIATEELFREECPLMPKRKINPATGEPELTYRQQRLVDEFVTNGGNGSDAARSAGYGSARSDQSAYQVLRRPEVQRHIQQRIAESRVRRRDPGHPSRVHAR